MHIVIFNPSVIPAVHYGGTERVIWSLGKALTVMGHRVSFIVNPGSYCDFAEVIHYQGGELAKLIPNDADILHSQLVVNEPLGIPTITTIHGNPAYGKALPMNSVFVSQNHASRYGSNRFVHNGLDFSEFGAFELGHQRKGFHFLAKASWRVKNVRGAIAIARKVGEPLAVLGGYRLNFKMGFRFTPYPSIKFYGMVGTAKKKQLLQHSKGLLFPVLWHEPFGLALIESLYFGCPVFGTPYGSLPELIKPEVGFISDKKSEIIENMRGSKFSPEECHHYAAKQFNAIKMAEHYLKLYKKVVGGECLNTQPPKLQEVATTKFLPLYD